MGSVTESLANLNEHLTQEYKKSQKRSSQINLILSKVLNPFLPSGIRCGSGIITDIKDRQVGPLDIIASVENFPPLGEGPASVFLADGVLFALQVRDWAENDLTEFGEVARHLKQLDRKRKTPIVCLAVSFGLLPLPELDQFMKSKSGQFVDGVLCVGHHIVLRNSMGWYGDSNRVPFVTERQGAEALKAFLFFILQLTQSAVNLPFGLADYQHL
jgi:hypothetical protein